MERVAHYCMCKARFTLRPASAPVYRRPASWDRHRRAGAATKKLRGRLLSRIGRQSPRGDEAIGFPLPVWDASRRDAPDLIGAGRSQPSSSIAILGCSQLATQLNRCSAQLRRAATTALIPMGCLSRGHVIKRVDAAGKFATSQAVAHRLMHRICGAFPEDSLIPSLAASPIGRGRHFSRRMISSAEQGMCTLPPVLTFVDIRPRCDASRRRQHRGRRHRTCPG
jgi:hypothetical protein